MLKLRFKFSPQTMFHLKVHVVGLHNSTAEEDDNTGVRVFCDKRYRAVTVSYTHLTLPTKRIV